MVRSMTSTPSASEMLRSWLPVSSPSNTAASAPRFSQVRRASASLPSPRTVPASGASFFWMRLATASMLFASHSAASSSMLRSASNWPMSSPSSSTFTGGVFCVICSLIVSPQRRFCLSSFFRQYERQAMGVPSAL